MIIKQTSYKIPNPKFFLSITAFIERKINLFSTQKRLAQAFNQYAL